jgi:hypothetical protein
MAAEANIRKSAVNVTKAQNYLNIVRDRALVMHILTVSTSNMG